MFYHAFGANSTPLHPVLADGDYHYIYINTVASIPNCNERVVTPKGFCTLQLGN
jgi:hypothetical protein